MFSCNEIHTLNVTINAMDTEPNNFQTVNSHKIGHSLKNNRHEMAHCLKGSRCKIGHSLKRKSHIIREWLKNDSHKLEYSLKVTATTYDGL
jgi:hypothetical protein